MKLTLGLSTYGNFLKISIYDGKKFCNSSSKYLNQEEIFFENINKLLKKIGGNFKDFENICYINGPGRFTGIRIAYTFAGVYSVLSGAKLYSVTTFDCLVYNLYEKLLPKKIDTEIAVILRAFKDEFFLSYYKLSKDKLKNVAKPVWLKGEELSEKLSSFKGYVIGDAEEFKDIYKLVKGKSIVADYSISKIKPENIIKSALYFKNKEKRPIYLKPAKYEISAKV